MKQQRQKCFFLLTVYFPKIRQFWSDPWLPLCFLLECSPATVQTQRNKTFTFIRHGVLSDKEREGEGFHAPRILSLLPHLPVNLWDYSTQRNYFEKSNILLFTIIWHIPLIWNQLVEELDVLSFNTCPRQDWNPSHPPPSFPPSFTPWPSFHLIILFNIFQLNMIDHSHWPGNTGLLKFSWKYRIANID